MRFVSSAPDGAGQKLVSRKDISDTHDWYKLGHLRVLLELVCLVAKFSKGHVSGITRGTSECLLFVHIACK